MQANNWKPEIEIIRFGTADIVTTSGIYTPGENEGEIM